MIYILLLLFYLGVPAVIVWLTLINKTIDKIGAVVISYAIGLLIGNIGIIPVSCEFFQEKLSSIIIAIAIPLVLFSSDIKKWLQLVKSTFISLFLGLVSVIIVVYIGFFIFNGKIDQIWKISGMLVGVYSGGTPNLAALSAALDVSDEIYIITNTSDLVVSSIFLLFFITIGKKTFEIFLPKFSFKDKQNLEVFQQNINDYNDYSNFFHKQNFLHVIIGVALALVIVGIAVLAGSVFNRLSEVVTILALTTLGLLGSLLPKIRTIKKTFPTGMYLIYVFSLIIASRADFRAFFQIETLNIFLYASFVVLGSLILHTLMSKIFKIDADTLIITTIALVYSVPFIPVVAGALKNKYIIISGIVIALIGYAVGNYLGVFVAYSLK